MSYYYPSIQSPSTRSPKAHSPKTVTHQRGVVMIFALLVLLSLTLLGLASVSSGLIQTKMASAMEQQSLAFDAAESAVAGAVFESEDETVLIDSALTDPLSEARQIAAIDLSVTTLSCFSDQGYASRALTQNGLQTGTRHIATGSYDSQARLNSWSRSAFVQEQACRGSSSVIGGSNINCHVFLIRGCGQVQDSPYAVANTLSATVFAPASQ